MLAERSKGVLYLLDANVLITAHNTYYPVDGVPEFWAWLLHVAQRDQVKMPAETFGEVRRGSRGADPLYLWTGLPETRKTLLLVERAQPALVQAVLDRGYGAYMDAQEIEQVGLDPFLIAYALAAPADRCVVTTEASRPSRKRANRHVPDVCKDLGLRCMDTFEMARSLGFKTGWAEP